jgi:hypothetical protein
MGKTGKREMGKTGKRDLRKEIVCVFFEALSY